MWTPAPTPIHVPVLSSPALWEYGNPGVQSPFPGIHTLSGRRLSVVGYDAEHLVPRQVGESTATMPFPQPCLCSPKPLKPTPPGDSEWPTENERCKQLIWCKQTWPLPSASSPRSPGAPGLKALLEAMLALDLCWSSVSYYLAASPLYEWNIANCT